MVSTTAGTSTRRNQTHERLEAQDSQRLSKKRVRHRGKTGPHLSMVSTTAGTSTRRISVSRPRYLMFGSRVLMNLASSAVAERSTWRGQAKERCGAFVEFWLLKGVIISNGHGSVRQPVGCGPLTRFWATSSGRQLRPWGTTATPCMRLRKLAGTGHAGLSALL